GAELVQLALETILLLAHVVDRAGGGQQGTHLVEAEPGLRRGQPLHRADEGQRAGAGADAIGLHRDVRVGVQEIVQLHTLVHAAAAAGDAQEVDAGMTGECLLDLVGETHAHGAAGVDGAAIRRHVDVEVVPALLLDACSMSPSTRAFVRMPTQLPTQPMTTMIRATTPQPLPLRPATRQTPTYCHTAIPRQISTAVVVAAMAQVSGWRCQFNVPSTVSSPRAMRVTSTRLTQ